MKISNICLAGVLLLGSSMASAGAYKCTDAKGKVSYQQQPCPSNATATKMKVDTPTWTLVKAEQDEWSRQEYYFDVDSVVTIDRFKRARFKQAVKFSGIPDGREAVFYQYYDCADGLVRTEIHDPAGYEQQLRADPVKMVGSWRSDNDHINDVHKVSSKICGS